MQFQKTGHAWYKISLLALTLALISGLSYAKEEDRDRPAREKPTKMCRSGFLRNQTDRKPKSRPIVLR